MHEINVQMLPWHRDWRTARQRLKINSVRGLERNIEFCYSQGGIETCYVFLPTSGGSCESVIAVVQGQGAGSGEGQPRRCGAHIQRVRDSKKAGGRALAGAQRRRQSSTGLFVVTAAMLCI